MTPRIVAVAGPRQSHASAALGPREWLLANAVNSEPLRAIVRDEASTSA